MQGRRLLQSKAAAGQSLGTQEKMSALLAIIESNSSIIQKPASPTIRQEQHVQRWLLLPFEENIIRQVDDMQLAVIGEGFAEVVGHLCSHARRVHRASHEPILAGTDRFLKGAMQSSETRAPLKIACSRRGTLSSKVSPCAQKPHINKNDTSVCAAQCIGSSKMLKHAYLLK